MFILQFLMVWAIALQTIWYLTNHKTCTTSHTTTCSGNVFAIWTNNGML